MRHRSYLGDALRAAQEGIASRHTISSILHQGRREIAVVLVARLRAFS